MKQSPRFTLRCNWVWRGWYDPPQSWRAWIFSRAHDSDSRWWCLLGLQICLRIRGIHF
jgi:hypothetical protein